MKEPSTLTRPRWCPQCGTRMRITGNPYYGVGLAVHQHLAACRRCGFVEFLPPVPRSAREEDPVPVPDEPSRWTRLLSRFVHVFARAK